MGFNLSLNSRGAAGKLRHFFPEPMKKFLLILVFTTSLWAAGKQPPPEILKIKLGASFEKAHARLNQIAHFKSEDEGQQVWVLDRDRHYEYAIVGFDHDRKVRYVTVLARPDGQPVNYEDIGDLAAATRFGQPGNLRYTWTLHDKKAHMDYEATVKGKDLHRLDRYSVKRLGVQQEEE